jgi:hypothetical protein
MKRPPRLLLALLTPIVVLSSAASYAASCANGNAIYHRQAAGVPISCSQSSCHGNNPDQNAKKGAASPGTIDNALDTQNEMLGLRETLSLSFSPDIEDLAEYLFFAAAGQPCPAPGPAFSAAPPSASFPSTNVGATSAPQNITITNTGTGNAATLTRSNSNATEFLASGTCTSAGSLAMGASCTLTVAFKPSGGGSRSGTYTLASGSNNVVVSFSGTGVAAAAPSVSASPTSLSFGSISVGSTSGTQTVTVSNSGSGDATDMSYPAAPASFIKGGTCAGSVLVAGTSCTVTFRYSPAAAGATNATYTINGGGASNPISLSGTGVAASPAALSAAPTTLSFGSVTVGATSSGQQVTVTNTGGSAATGVTVGNSNAAEFPVSANTCGAALAAGGTCTFSVAYKPGAAGADAASLTIGATGVASVTVNLSGTGTAAPTANLQAAPATVAFGSVTIGQTSAGTTVTITNSGGAAATGVAFVNSNATEFVVSGNTCGATIANGASCAFAVAYAPGSAGADSATLSVNFAGGTLAIALTGTGVAPPPPGQGQLSFPAADAFGTENVGSASAPHTITVSNTGSAAVIVTAITSSAPSEFTVGNNTCATVAAGASCTFTLTFTPAAAGARAATITFASNGAGSPQTLAASGTGAGGTPPPPVGTPTTAVEYYHAEFDHYFMTFITDEVTKLDNGTFRGWERTGRSFKVYANAGAGLNAVCRFFSTAFDPKSSHFYTPVPSECAVVKTNANWMFEAEVFHVAVPDFDGNCPAATQPVYRVYNDGQGAAPNHRYTTDLAVRNAMLALGWIPEGMGKIGVIMCAPL